MKKSAKIAIICSIAGICIIAAIIGFIAGRKAIQGRGARNGKVSLAFYNVDESQEAVFTRVVEEICEKDELGVSFYKISGDKDFAQQVKENKINLVLAPAGYSVEKAGELVQDQIEISDQAIGSMFSSMRQSIIEEDGKLKALPLIFDNLEIDIEVSAFKMSGMDSIASWTDIEEFAEYAKKKGSFPISFAGADSAFLLDLLGAFGEAFDGYDAYLKAVQILKDAAQEKASGNGFDAAATAKKIFIDVDAPLPYSTYYLKQLVKKGYLVPSSRELVNNDINSFIQQRVTNAFFTKLSVHRTFDTKAVSRFSTIYVPSKNPATQRHFTATITYAVPLTANKGVQKLIEELLSAEVQAKLSQLTGLAPVLANCQTPDKQADDARFWVAATNFPLAGLSREAELSSAEIKALADEVRAMMFY